MIPIPDEFPTFIQPEWDTAGTSPQVFIGDYYLILDSEGRGRYGSAREQRENMHRRLDLTREFAGVPAMAWVKVLIPQGYTVDEHCSIITLIPTEGGSIREGRHDIESGTLVLQQPGGEFQFFGKKNQPSIYYSQEDAERLGLTSMSEAEFEQFAFATALRSLMVARP